MLCFVCVVSMGSHGHRLRIHRHTNHLDLLGMLPESLNDALIECVRACGGSKTVDELRRQVLVMGKSLQKALERIEQLDRPSLRTA